ncbi:MAG: tyrosine--tRNA ligase [Parachlamydiaceae bacterium]
MPHIIDVLKERGFIEALTSEEIRQLVEKPTRIYCGFDPTADSLHLGNLVAIMGLAWFQRFGHTPVAIIGGATGMIGDPSGKTSDRQLLDEATLQNNLKGIQKNLEAILDFNHSTARPLILNNFNWYKDFSFIQFLREIGSLFRIGPMLAKDSVKLRLQSEEGMSFTEFSYQILQGYDFLYLMKHHDVTIQLGGSDQWGNITSGTELIRKVLGKPAYGVTFPLLTRSDGQKFGKSEKGAIWLSSDKLSPYEFYQYLIRVEDADVIKLMRMLTFMEMDEIHRYAKAMKDPDYIPRTAQKRLAEEVTYLVHGKSALETAIKVTEGIAPGSQTTLDAEILESLSADMPSCKIPLEAILKAKLIDFLVEIGLQSSKGEARRLIRNGGVYINNEKVGDENCVIDCNLLIDGRLMLLAAGKKNKMLVRITDE